MKPDLLHNKTFRALANTDNGEVSGETRFHYFQQGDVVWADYQGGDILRGHLLGKVVEQHLEFVYHHLNREGELMTGRCRSFPEWTADGRLCLREYWQWTCRDHSSGESLIVEV
ncbi:MAG: hypothetical protein U0U46_07145 [Saprospiraceae bacterium]